MYGQICSIPEYIIHGIFIGPKGREDAGFDLRVMDFANGDRTTEHAREQT